MGMRIRAGIGGDLVDALEAGHIAQLGRTVAAIRGPTPGSIWRRCLSSSVAKTAVIAASNSAKRTYRSSRWRTIVRTTMLRAAVAREVAVDCRATCCSAWACSRVHGPALTSANTAATSSGLAWAMT